MRTLHSVVSEFVNGSRGAKLADLYGRWLDEREYEDFADYATAMSKLMPDCFKFVKGTKQPFGFHASCAGKMVAITAKVVGKGIKVHASWRSL